MTVAADATTLQAFFLPGSAGRLFALRFGPAAGGAARRCVLFFPPFAEEMNRARRQVSVQARALAAAGYAVLLVDPYGTGDSEGDFSAARWEIWREDARRCMEWLLEQGAHEIVLWGLRLGAILAAETALDRSSGIERLLLWQPVIRGEAAINQFLRLRVAAEMSVHGSGTSVRELRELAERDGQVEIAGYTIDRALIRGVDTLSLERLLPAAPVEWMEIAPAAEHAPAAASRPVIERWRTEGASVEVRGVVGEPFWSTLEVAVVPELVRATNLAMRERAV